MRIINNNHKKNNMKTTSEVIQDEILELKIQKALVEHWNPKKAEIFEAAIKELTNIYENKNNQTQRSTGQRHSRNFIRKIESGCEIKCQKSNKTSDLHS